VRDLEFFFELSEGETSGTVIVGTTFSDSLGDEDVLNVRPLELEQRSRDDRHVWTSVRAAEDHLGFESHLSSSLREARKRDPRLGCGEDPSGDEGALHGPTLVGTENCPFICTSFDTFS
jgi:hypothetical protein